MLALILAASLGADPAPPFVVTNRCEATFVVTNRTGEAKPTYLPACVSCSPCACPSGVCPACPATTAKASADLPATLVIGGVPHVRGGDNVYRPVAGAVVPVRQSFAPAPVYASPLSFAPSYGGAVCTTRG